MLDLCNRVANDLSLSLYSLKSTCLVIGKLAKQPIKPMSLGSGQMIHSSISGGSTGGR